MNYKQRQRVFSIHGVGRDAALTEATRFASTFLPAHTAWEHTPFGSYVPKGTIQVAVDLVLARAHAALDTAERKAGT